MKFLTIDLPYDKTDIHSVINYAKTIEGKTLRDVIPSDVVEHEYKGKGGLGQKVEEMFFYIENNSDALPDLQELQVEIKTTPLKQIQRGLVSKERLVFSIINYDEEHNFSFSTSTFWKKNNHLLLLFYIHESEKIDIDYIFKIVRLWQFPPADLKIIKDDWTTIVTKIRNGKAHEISEGDTIYLGACTKGANKESLRKQPFSEEMAMQRAFSLKSKYLNFIIEKSLAGEDVSFDINEYLPILSDNLNGSDDPYIPYKKLNLKELEPIVKNIKEYSTGETFEQLVTRKFEPYYGKTDEEIIDEFDLDISSAKSKFYLIAKAILGISKKKIEEFEKADIEMKTIRLEKNGNLKESMSFAQIKFKEIIEEEWEESYWNYILTKRFFFVIFQKDENENFVLKKVQFWTMPLKDLNFARLFWEDTKKKILNDDYENFIKISDNKICHVRPKGVNSLDLMETPSGRLEKKKSYWLNASYIKSIIQ